MVSVVIPIFNVQKYLNECVQSVMNQTYKDLEIILVDDGSTDGCGLMCDEYAKLDERVKVVHKENGGLSSARNAGIEIAQGKYLTFIDSDDYIAMDMIEQLLYSIKQTNADISVCKMTLKNDDMDKNINEKAYLYTKEQVLKFILKEQKIMTSACGKLYKKELFDSIRYPEGRIYEDLGTTYKLIDLSKKIAFAEAKKYYYRTNVASITKSAFSNKHLDYYIIAEELQAFVKKKYPRYLKFAINHSVRISISFMKKISICNFNDKKTIEFLVSKIRRNIFGYLFSGYSVFSKLYGLLICICPPIALSLFNLKKQRGRKNE